MGAGHIAGQGNARSRLVVSRCARACKFLSDTSLKVSKQVRTSMDASVMCQN